MRKRARIIAFLLLACGCAALLVALYPMLALDGLSMELVLVTITEDTEYAPGYTTSGFRDVRPGMSEFQVLDLLGPPLKSVETEETRVWCYSSAGHYADGSGRVRDVVFQSARVVEIRTGAYID